MFDKDIHGHYVFSKPMVPAFVANTILSLPYMTPLVPAWGSRAEAMGIITSACFMTAVFASGACRAAALLPGKTVIDRKRHNNMLVVGTAAVGGMASYAFVCQPVPSANVDERYLAGTGLGCALALTLLWAGKSNLRPILRAKRRQDRLSPARFTY